MLSFMEMPPANRSPYSRTAKSRQQFRRHGTALPSASVCANMPAPEEISVVIAALQLRWHELSAQARGANGTNE